MEIQKVLKACILVAGLLWSTDVVADEHLLEQVNCLAQNIYFESRNQPKTGKIAVSQVVMNRVQSPLFPNTPCAVVKQQVWRRGKAVCQFSWFCDGKSDKPEDGPIWNESIYLALGIYTKSYFDVTEGALWYHATYVSPNWAKTYKQTVRINDHIFYK
jgi:spore germination cell wall hydrolase CwlJ-like protein